jgi:glycerophosphoryl diester phosphodiesterase
MAMYHPRINMSANLFLDFLIIILPAINTQAHKVFVKFDSGFQIENAVEAKFVEHEAEHLVPFTDHVLIAHAGGALPSKDEVHTYTNALEAVEFNYQKGYRIFEIDFNLTKDGKLAAVHDWQIASGLTGSIWGPEGPELQEWKSEKILGKYTSMDVEDVMRLMDLHRDMFVVTDTKDVEAEAVSKEFLEIRRAAEKVNMNILKRIVPQIYNPQMLETVSLVYPFENIIYTLYQSNQNQDQVLNFVRDNDRIKAVTMGEYTASENFVHNLAEIGKPVYVHTVNSVSDASELHKKGVHGLYTDSLFFTHW